MASKQENDEKLDLENVVEDGKMTPMMQQYVSIKKDYPDCLLMMRMGDFYEMFFEDARIASQAIGITLTKRGTYNGEPIPMSGVPHHSFDIYARRLLRMNFRLAICEQLESPEAAKKRGYKALVERGVVRVITAGTIFEDEYLEGATNNFLLAFSVDKKYKNLGVAVTDISTGDFFTISADVKELKTIIERYKPVEIISPNFVNNIEDIYDLLKDLNVKWLPDAKFDIFSEKNRLMERFNVKTLDSFGKFEDEEVIAAGVIVDYINLTQKGNFPLAVPRKIIESEFLHIDAQTIKNLDILCDKNNDKRNSLVGTIKNTRTAFGGRLFEMRALFPLKNIEKINARLNAVEFFIKYSTLRIDVLKKLSEIPDFERAVSRIKFRRAAPSDFGMLLSGLIKTAEIKSLLLEGRQIYDNEIYEKLNDVADFEELIVTLQSAFNDVDLPNNLRSNGFIKRGYNAELDEYRNLVEHSANMISELEGHYARETGVSNLKIKFNNIIGYFVEVPSSKKNMMPEEFIKKQDTVNSVRYKTLEISDLEQKLVVANDRFKELELALFYELVDCVSAYYERIKIAITALAVVDIAVTNAEFALENNFAKPILDDSLDIEIKAGRHIVIEKKLGDAYFVPNDTYITKSKLSIVTGPNMAGKSTYLRQNALIVIMAHMGIYVPAESARIGIVDKVFSRIGASDDLASGKSTFMVEMIETATILNQATERSFVILDEVGRGTSTYDGFAIASGVLDYLYHVNKSRAFFATHYHEIQCLSLSMPLLKFLTLRISEHGDDVIFHHQIINGIVDKSYGLYVAKIAGIPSRALRYSKEMLKKLNGTDVINQINVQKLDLK